MTNLHGFLAQLGIDAQRLHPQQADEWSDETFQPQTGATYDIAFGRLAADGKMQPVVRRVRIDGAEANQWFDMDAERALEPALQVMPVQAYRRVFV
jgi:muconolactone delta-isomerase